MSKVTLDAEKINSMLREMRESNIFVAFAIEGIKYKVYAIGVTIPYEDELTVKEVTYDFHTSEGSDDIVTLKTIQMELTATHVQLEPYADLKYGDTKPWIVFKYPHFMSLVSKIKAEYKMFKER